MKFKTVESINEDTIKVKDGKWVNKGKDGVHGTFKTKKEADAQRKAMFARGFKPTNEGVEKRTISDEEILKAVDEYADIIKYLEDK